MTKEPNALVLFGKRMANRMGRPLGVHPFPRAFPNPLGQSATSQGVFDAIYQTNLWGSPESRSGTGSESAFAARYRGRLAVLLQERGFKSLFDAPCGDLNWMATLISDGQISYQGGDVSASVVAEVKLKHPQIAVSVFNICDDRFPDADLWHCRDCLFHLPFADIRAAFANFAASRIPYALLTTHRARLLHRNLDVGRGGFRFLDLEHAPFNLSRPECYLPDYRSGVEFPRFMALWPREMLARSVDRWQV